MFEFGNELLLLERVDDDLVFGEYGLGLLVEVVGVLDESIAIDDQVIQDEYQRLQTDFLLEEDEVMQD